MAENEIPAQPRMQVLSQFIRDLSFENVAAQKSLNVSDNKPEISVNVGLDAGKIGDDLYEVKMKINIDASTPDTKVFVLEMEYSGRFMVQNVPEAQLHPYLLIECPRVLFPYVRRIISDVTHDGGYPPLNVDNIDFVNLYRQELQRRQAQVQAETAGDRPN